MTIKERVELTIKSNIAFHNAKKLNDQINEYNNNPLKYEEEHPDFKIDETKKLCQEFMDVFEEGFNKLKEDV